MQDTQGIKPCATDFFVYFCEVGCFQPTSKKYVVSCVVRCFHLTTNALLNLNFLHLLKLVRNIWLHKNTFFLIFLFFSCVVRCFHLTTHALLNLNLLHLLKLVRNIWLHKNTFFRIFFDFFEKKVKKNLEVQNKVVHLQHNKRKSYREMAERFNAAVLKTVDCHRSGGSNPSFSTKKNSL